MTAYKSTLLDRLRREIGTTEPQSVYRTTPTPSTSAFAQRAAGIEAQIVALLRDGASQHAVARAYGLDPATVGRMGTRAGLVFDHGRKSAAARQGASVRQEEADFLGQVRDAARLLGWLEYHTRLSKGSPAGFPDLVLVRAGRDGHSQVIFAELKTDIGVLTPAQKTWGALLGACPGIDYRLWRPRDWDTIVELLR